MTDNLHFLTFAFDVKIHSFVLMSNHFHLLISTPKANLSEAMNYFMRETSKEINRISGHKNQIFGGRYSRTSITSQFYFGHAYKYVYRNPVTAGIVDKCEKYPFSTLHGLLGQSRICVPTIEDTFLYGNGRVEEVLMWLNTAPTQINYEIFKMSLKRKTMKFPVNKWNHLQHSLEHRIF